MADRADVAAGAGARRATWWAPVWFLARTGLRRRWRSSVALALLIGLSAGVVVAATAGARRSNTSVRRFMGFHRTANAYVQSPETDRLKAVLRLPQVAGASDFTYVLLAFPRSPGLDVTPFAAGDDRQFRTESRILMLRGRVADPSAPFEVVVNEAMARDRGLRVGSRFPMAGFSLQHNRAAAASGALPTVPPDGPVFMLQVVGVGRLPVDLSTGEGSDLYLTPAFLGTYARDLGVGAEEILRLYGDGSRSSSVRLRHGRADIASFEAAARSLLGPEGRVSTGLSDATIAAEGAQRSVGIQALALLGLAAVAGLLTMVVVGQVIARQAALDAGDGPVLASLGMARGQLVAAAVAGRGLLAGGAGSLLAVAVAVALSPVFPVGLARRAEVHPGLSIDAGILAGGAAVTLALVLVGVVLATARALRAEVRARRAVRTRPSRLVEAAGRMGLRPPATVGIGMATGTNRRLSVAPGPGALAVAVAGVVAAATLATSLALLGGDPGRQGWNWDVLIGNPNAVGDPAELTNPLAASADIAAASGISSIGSLDVDGRSVDALAFDDLKGRAAPTVLGGTAPAGPDEIALASTTLRSLGRRVGDTVMVAGVQRTVAMRVSGRIVMPTAGDFWGSSLSRGVVVTTEGARRLVDDVDPARLFAVRLAPGVPQAEALARLRRQFGDDLVQSHTTPQDLENLAAVAWMPYALAGLLVLVGGVAMSHSLVTSVRGRRRDLAVLKALGFARRQVAATVAWQATTFATLALAVGVPAGLVVGRWAWTLLATATGTFSPPVVPFVPVGLVFPATVLAANLVASIPARAAARTRPALALRVE